MERLIKKCSNRRKIFKQRPKDTNVPGMSRNSYSLVSCSDVTSGSLAVWLELPDQIKYDPSLAPFRQRYESECKSSDEVPPNTSIDDEAIEPRNEGSNERQQQWSAANTATTLDNGKLHIKPLQSANDSNSSRQHSIQVGGVSRKQPSKVSIAGHYVKMSLLLAIWLFFTTIFICFGEKDIMKIYTSVPANGTLRGLPINHSEMLNSMYLMLEGPFVSEIQQEHMINSPYSSYIQVWFTRDDQTGNTTVLTNYTQTSNLVNLMLANESEIEFTRGVRRTTILRLNNTKVNQKKTSYVHRLYFVSNSSRIVGMKLEFQVNPLEQRTGVVYAALLLMLLYVLIIFEIINRSLASVLVSTLSLSALAAVGERPSLEELVSWLDMETLILLFSMMLLVAILAETGLFDHVAVCVFSVTNGKTWPLINLLCFITAALSTVLDNVTTVLLMTPVTIRLCEVIYLNPVPILISMVIYSNIGGTATPVGDPPNVIIASNPEVINTGITFAEFTGHMTVGILLVAIQTYIQMRYCIYRSSDKLRHSVPRDVQELRQQIQIWSRSAASLPCFSKDEGLVKKALERKVTKLQIQLDSKVKENRKRSIPAETFEATLKELKSKYKIRDKPLLIKSSIAIIFVVGVFFLHSLPELKSVSLGWTALLGAILLLILADKDDIEPILHRVEWSTLLFFASLFVLMESLSKLGLIQWIGGLTETLIMSVNEEGRLAVAILLMLWVSGIASAFVDNIPLTTMMVRVVTSLGNNPSLGLPMAPLIWALSFGACLGGNGTLIGASANVVTAGVAEQHGYKFTFVEFFKVGFPIMLGHLVTASGYLLLCHCVFAWH